MAPKRDYSRLAALLTPPKPEKPAKEYKPADVSQKEKAQARYESMLKKPENLYWKSPTSTIDSTLLGLDRKAGKSPADSVALMDEQAMKFQKAEEAAVDDSTARTYFQERKLEAIAAARRLREGAKPPRVPAARNVKISTPSTMPEPLTDVLTRNAQPPAAVDVRALPPPESIDTLTVADLDYIKKLPKDTKFYFTHNGKTELKTKLQ